MRVLRARSDLGLRVLPAPSPGELIRALPEADAVVMVMEVPALSAELIESAPRLRIAARFGAGYDNVDLGALTRRRIPLVTTGGANADAVAEHALYLMLALAKRGPALERAVKTGGWPRAFGGVELAGRSCAIVGLGRIGRAIARRVEAFGMAVLAADPGRPGTLPLEEALARADVVVLACALNAQTRGLMGRRMFERMKPGAFLVNVARGAVVDEAALVAALESGRLRGAGLDVLEREPPCAANPLLSRDDVVLSPHVGAYIDSVYDRMALACAQGVLAGLDGRLDPETVVNPEVLAR